MELTSLDETLGIEKKKLVLEMTYACNSACYNCCSNSHPKKGKTNYMGLDTAKKAVDYVLQYGIDYALFTGGEPTLVPHLQNIVDYAHSKGMKTRINTNGWKNSLQYWKDLKIRGLDSAVVSIDSSHNHHKMNRKPIPLENALETLEIMIKLEIETVVPIIPSPNSDSEKYDIALYKYMRDKYRRIGTTTNTDKYTELLVDGKKTLDYF